MSIDAHAWARLSAHDRAEVEAFGEFLRHAGPRDPQDPSPIVVPPHMYDYATGRPTADRVVAALAPYRFRYASEFELHDLLERALVDQGMPVEREVPLTRGGEVVGRADLLVGAVGVEVKVAGSPGSVLRQLRRHATAEQVHSLVLVTNRARHRDFPDDIDGVPLRVAALLKGAL